MAEETIEFYIDDDDENVTMSPKVKRIEYSATASHARAKPIDCSYYAIVKALFSVFDPASGYMRDTIIGLMFLDGITYNYCPKPAMFATISGLLDCSSFYEERRPGIRFSLIEKSTPIVIDLDHKDTYICYDKLVLGSGVHRAFSNLHAFENLSGSLSRNWVCFMRLLECTNMEEYYKGSSYYNYVKHMTSAEYFLFVDLFKKIERCKWLSLVKPIEID